MIIRATSTIAGRDSASLDFHSFSQVACGVWVGFVLDFILAPLHALRAADRCTEACSSDLLMEFWLKTSTLVLVLVQ